MKKIGSIFCLSALSLAALCADDNATTNLQDVSAETMIDSDSDNKPFRVFAQGDWIQSSNIDKKDFHHQHVKFYTAEIQAQGIFYYDACHEEALGAGIGYTNSRFDWNKNHFFHEKNMNQVSLTVLASSKRLCNWLWQASVTANWEPKYQKFWDYTNYDLLLWGQYSFNQTMNWHFGFLALVGMKVDNIYPVFGFDWAFWDQWKLNLVFPLNLSLEYQFDCDWTAAAAIRFFDIRYRFGRHEKLDRGLLHYRNNGAELAINYNKDQLKLNVHAGVTFAGQFVISNRHNKHKKHFDMDSAAYAGAEASFKF